MRRSRPPTQLIARALVRRRRALLAGAQRKRARTQRGGVGRRRGGGEAAGQRPGAEAGRHRSPIAASSWSVARAKFDESRTPQSDRLRDRRSISASCWPSSGRGAGRPRCSSRPPRCLEGNDNGVPDEEIAAIQASGDPPARKAGKIARREQYIAKGRRQIATSWFNTAVAYYNLSRKTRSAAVRREGGGRRAVRRAGARPDGTLARNP